MMHNFWVNLHFLRPWAFALFLVVLGLLYQLKQSNQAWGAWKTICSPALLEYLQMQSKSMAEQPSEAVLAKKGNRMAMLALIWVSTLLILALAGPVWKKMPQPVYQSDSALIVALDLSLSMDAQDVKPSRLTRAKQKITDLLRLRRDGQTALIAFAGTAHVVTPLTDDVETIASQLRELSTDIMPKQGGNLDAAMVKAWSLLKQSGVKHGVILFLTDSNQFSEAVVKQLTQAGHRLDVIGIGTADGAPIPKSQGGFLTDNQGHMIMPTLDESGLQNLAALGRGTYHNIHVQQDDLDDVLSQLKPSAWTQGKAQTQTYDAWYEEGSWLLATGLACGFIGLSAWCFGSVADGSGA